MPIVFSFLETLWYTGLVSEKYKRRPNIDCYICKKAIYRRPSEIEKTDGRAFCSPSCYGIFCRKELPCVVCGKPILSSLHRKTCSRECSNKNRAGIKYKLHTPRKDKVRDQRAVKIRLIKERGKFCQRCGYDKLEILQVHHKDRNTQNNNLENLELICPNCHCEEHYLEKSWLKNFES